MKRLLALVMFFVASAHRIDACSCGFVSDFGASARAALVVRGIVREYVSMPGHAEPIAMKVEVLETLNGSYRAKRITIIGDFGMSCIPYVSNFPIGTEWVMAVHGPSETDGLGDEIFAPPPCAAAFLRVDHGKVPGIDRNSRAPITIDELRAWLAAPRGTKNPPR